jgi:hypothetical protein
MTESGAATGYGWSLGAALGYEVWSLSGQTITIRGNGFGTWNEPGIVWVQEDKNANGVPDEMWYEVKGGDDGSNYSNQISRRYAVKYFNNPEIEARKYGQILRRIYWVDSKGRAGILPAGWPGNAVAATEFGAAPKGWGVSANSNWLIYTGTILRDTEIGDGSGVAGATAYVDCFYGNSPGITVDKSNAIDAAGNPVTLGDIRFVKVQTGVFSYNSDGGFGEISTEIHSAAGLGQQTSFPLPEDS